jgi:hypothetical protein
MFGVPAFIKFPALYGNKISITAFKMDPTDPALNDKNSVYLLKL